jgi:hypothetical protein
MHRDIARFHSRTLVKFVISPPPQMKGEGHVQVSPPPPPRERFGWGEEEQVMLDVWGRGIGSNRVLFMTITNWKEQQQEVDRECVSVKCTRINELICKKSEC